MVRHYGRVQARTSDARLDGLGGVEASAVLLGAPPAEKPAPQPGKREAWATRQRGHEETREPRRGCGEARPFRAGHTALPRWGGAEIRPASRLWSMHIHVPAGDPGVEEGDR